MYVRITAVGGLTTTPLADLTDEPLAWNGSELAYYVAMPSPHLVLFALDDVGTAHSVALAGSAYSGASADVAPSPSHGSAFEVFYTVNDNGKPAATRAYSDGTSTSPGTITVALGLSPDGNLAAVGKWYGSPGAGELWEDFVESTGGGPGGSLTSDPHQAPSGEFDIVGGASITIVRNGIKTWKLDTTGTTVLPGMPPLAWNGDVFITASGRDVVYDDAASFQPIVTRPNALPAGDLVGVGATKRRALFMLAADTGDVEYVQICL